MTPERDLPQHGPIGTNAETGARKEKPPYWKGRPELLDPDVLRRDAIHAQLGAAKYADWNWEKGVKLSEALGACLRHIIEWWRHKRGDEPTIEDHLAAARFWLMVLMNYEHRIGHTLPESLDDLCERKETTNGTTQVGDVARPPTGEAGPGRGHHEGRPCETGEKHQNPPEGDGVWTRTI